jgi:hypothetical protein
MSRADLEAWEEAFPDPVDSPACYTHSLLVGSVQVITVATAEGGGWVRAFRNVVRLRIWGGMMNLQFPPLPPLLTGSRIRPHSLCNPFILTNLQANLSSTPPQSSP